MPDGTPASSGAAAPVKLFSVDTPVGKLCGHPEARAVVDRDLPGLTSRPEYLFFKHMSLRQLQAASNGKMTEEALARVSLDLDALGAPGPVPIVRASAALP